MKLALRSALLAAAVSASCGLRPDPPRITPRSVSITGVSNAGLGLHVDLVANNPNRLDLTVQSISVRVTLAGRDLGVSRIPNATRLPSRQDVPLAVDVTAPWQDLPGILLATTLNENIPYHLDGTARVGTASVNLDVPFQVDSTMPRSVLTNAVWH